MAKKRINWKPIKRAYEDSAHSVPNIAKKYKIHTNTIYAKAKRDNWNRTPRKAGRPTDYKQEYCKKIVEYFTGDPFETCQDGKKIANPLPTFQNFAHEIGVHIDTLNEWKHTHGEFSEAYKKAKSLQESWWLTNSLLGLFPPAFACFFGKNVFRYQDRIDHELTGKGGGPIEFSDTERAARLTAILDAARKRRDKPSDSQ